MKRKISFIALLLGVFLLVACAHQMRGYVSARTILNNYWESYLDMRDAMPNGPEKDAFRVKFNDTGKSSYFTEADEALDIWQASIGTSGEVDASRIYYGLFNKVVAILMSEGIIKIE